MRTLGNSAAMGGALGASIGASHLLMAPVPLLCGTAHAHSTTGVLSLPVYSVTHNTVLCNVFFNNGYLLVQGPFGARMMHT